jgi:predicted acyltransferase
MNPLFLYVLSEALAVGLYAVGFHDNGSWISAHKALYNIINVKSLSPYGASLLFAFILVGFNWFVGYILYKKKIFIKI